MLFEATNNLASTYIPQAKYTLPYPATRYKMVNKKAMRKLLRHSSNKINFNAISHRSSTSSSRTSRETVSARTKESVQLVARPSPLQ